MRFAAIIFDFDGVLADSEALAARVLAEHVSRLGLPTTVDQALDRYMGQRWPEAMALIEAGLGRALPGDFSDTLGCDARPFPGGPSRGRGRCRVHLSLPRSAALHRLVEFDRPAAALPRCAGDG